MQKERIQQFFRSFLSHYDTEAKDGFWAKQSQVFKSFWTDKVLSRHHRELADAEVDQVVRILDRNGKGNTKDSEAVARAMIAQGAWRRMFNDIKANKELSETINAIFVEHDPDMRAKHINKLYAINAERRNNLTGQSGNAINAMLAAFDPIRNLSVISLRDRRTLYEFFDISPQLDFAGADIGGLIVLSNKGIVDYFRAVAPQHSARTFSVFLYSHEFKQLWKPDKGEDHDTVPEAHVATTEVTDPALFYMESQLEDFLIENWDKTELGKKYALIEEDGDLVSQQYRTSIGVIDILARDKRSGQYVVIELKKSQTSDDTVGQLTRYMGWLEAHKSGGELTKGIIIAGQYDERLDYALRKLKDVEVYLYQVDFKLKEFTK